MRHFELTPQDLVRGVKEQLAVAQQSLEAGVESGSVQSALRTLLSAGWNYQEGLELFFNDGVPAELGRLCSCATVTVELKRATGSQNLTANSGVLLEGLAAVGAMAAVAVAGEVAIEKEMAEQQLPHKR